MNNFKSYIKKVINGVKHYENFPVASLLLPKNLRSAIQHIYQFARSADDIADEGDSLPYERLKKLYEYSTYLNAIQNHNLENFDKYPSLFLNLQSTINKHNLSIKYFHQLIHAFRQDVTKNTYQTKQQVLEYCAYSANPIGRILLELYKKHTIQNLVHSDNICTALQLINFYQDVLIDYHKQRFYLSFDILSDYNLSLDNIKDLCKFTLIAKNNNPKKHIYWKKWQQMMHSQVKIAQNMLLSGLPLCNNLPNRAGIELKCMIYAANTICNKLHKIDYDIFTKRPILKWYDWITIMIRTILKKI